MIELKRDLLWSGASVWAKITTGYFIFGTRQPSDESQSMLGRIRVAICCGKDDGCQSSQNWTQSIATMKPQSSLVISLFVIQVLHQIYCEIDQRMFN
jgi:hypothetical protein